MMLINTSEQPRFNTTDPSEFLIQILDWYEPIVRTAIADAITTQLGSHPVASMAAAIARGGCRQ